MRSTQPGALPSVDAAKTRKQTDTPRNAVALCPRSRSVSWRLADGQRKWDQNCTTLLYVSGSTHVSLPPISLLQTVSWIFRCLINRHQFGVLAVFVLLTLIFDALVLKTAYRISGSWKTLSPNLNFFAIFRFRITSHYAFELCVT